jgi:tRNA G18 (ribose-2'-O)-methylase SpoU
LNKRKNIHTLDYEKIALVFGNEVDGVDQEVIDASDYIIEIPQFGTKHSLNVSVCAGVILWEFAKRYI